MGTLSPQDVVRVEQTGKVFSLSQEILKEILSYVSAPEVICLGRTCTFFYQNVWSLYFHDSFRRLWATFFASDAEISGFRKLQAERGVVVSGSHAVQFLDQVSYPNSDLDVYCSQQDAEAVETFLSPINYIFTPRLFQNPIFGADLRPDPKSSDDNESNSDDIWSEYQDDEEFEGILDVFDFKRDGKTIQLIVARNTPMEVILSYHSTIVMNFLTYDKVYSLFPQSTFTDRVGMTLRDTDEAEEAHQKYRDRGWVLDSSESESQSNANLNPEFRSGYRWVGDKQCLTVHLPKLVEGGAKIDTTALSYDFNSWKTSAIFGLTFEPILVASTYYVAAVPIAAVWGCSTITGAREISHCPADPAFRITVLKCFEILSLQRRPANPNLVEYPGLIEKLCSEIYHFIKSCDRDATGWLWEHFYHNLLRY